MMSRRILSCLLEPLNNCAPKIVIVGANGFIGTRFRELLVWGKLIDYKFFHYHETEFEFNEVGDDIAHEDCLLIFLAQTANSSLTDYSPDQITFETVMRYRWRKIIYVSSAKIYASEKIYNREDAQLASTPYARIKLQCEEFLRPESIILRIPFVIDYSRPTTGFLKEFRSGLAEGKYLIFDDEKSFQFVSPRMLLEVIIELFEKGIVGIFNFAHPIEMTKNQMVERHLSVSNDWSQDTLAMMRPVEDQFNSTVPKLSCQRFVRTLPKFEYRF